MGMQHSPVFCHLLELNEETLNKFEKTSEFTHYLITLVADGLDACDMEEDKMIKNFLAAFEKHYGVRPSIVFLNDEVEGCDGAAEPEKYFLYFDDNDKYEPRVVRPEWDALPVKPEESSWANFG